MIPPWPWGNPLWNQTPTDVIMCTWVGFRPICWKCWSNNVLSTILSWWPYHDLGITPLWNPTPTHVTTCTWLWFWPIYFYTTLRVKGTILWWPLVTLSMHGKSADHLKVTWHIIRLRKNILYKNTRRGGTGGPNRSIGVHCYGLFFNQKDP